MIFCKMELESRNLNAGIYYTKKFTEFESSIELEHIIDTRIGKDCKRHYLVSFKSWLTEDKLHQHQDLIERFWKDRSQVGGRWSDKHDDESHSDKENKYIPENELTFKNTPLLDSPSYEKHSTSYEQHSPTFPGEVNTTAFPDEVNITENGHRANGLQSNCVENHSNDGEHFVNNGINDGEHEEPRVNEHDSNNQEFSVDNQDHEHSLNKQEHNNSLDGEEVHEAGVDNEQEATPERESLENSDDSTETVDISVENIECTKKQDDDAKSTRPASSFSDKTTSSCSERPLSSSSDRLPKKRKLKTLDDIVRKISGTTDQPSEKKNCNDNLLTDRLQTLDKTLRGDYTKIKTEPDVENHESFIGSPSSDSRERYDRFPNGSPNGNQENVYWSAGKVIHKQLRPFRCFTCGTKFEHEDELNQHQRVHLENDEKKITPQDRQGLDDVQRAYTCRHCGDVYPTIPALDKHRFEAHKGRRRYEKCQFCSTMYSDPVLLRRHEETHFRGYKQYREENNGHPPPLIHNESSRAFPQYQRNEDERSNGRRQDEHNNRQGEPNRESEQMEVHRATPSINDTESNSIIRNPIRNLLGKMYHSQQEAIPHLQRDLMQQDPKSRSQRDPIPIDSIPHRYAQFMQETHGFPPTQLSPQFDQRSPVMTAPPRNENGDNHEKDSYREVLHICPVCNKAFSKVDAFHQHYIISHGDRPILNCNGCRETFHHGKEIFQSHLKSHLQRGYECGMCRKVFYTSSSYEAHLQTHTHERPFQCHICGRNFSSRTNLRRHVMLHTEIIPYRCHLCSKGFKRGEELNAHMHEFHGRVIVENDTRKSREQPVKDDRYIEERRHGNVNGHNSPSPVYHQHQIREQFDDKQLTKKNRQFRNQDHYVDETKAYPFDPSMQYPGNPGIHHMPPVHHITADPNMSRHQNNGDEPSSNHQLLKMVPVITPSHYSPVKPTAMHVVAQPPLPHSVKMKCHECDEEFTSQSLYEIHLQSHAKEIYSCKKCSKTFTKKSQFDSHTVHSHENNKSHNCPYCHRSFSMKGNLRRHIRIHTNEAPYECPICFQRFRRSDGLKGHIKRHETMGETAPTDMVPSQASAQAAK